MINEIIRRSAREAVEAAKLLESEEALLFIENIARELAAAFQKGQKVLIAGNGGSLCDAAHFAEELTGNFRKPRAALPAIALTDPGHITCVGNDFGFDAIFSRGVEAYGQAGDLFIGLSTSGNSRNITRAFEEAKKKKMVTIAFLGKDGGALRGVADYEWIVEGFSYSDRIQEAHMAAIHMAIEAMEELLFPKRSLQETFEYQVTV